MLIISYLELLSRAINGRLFLKKSLQNNIKYLQNRREGKDNNNNKSLKRSSIFHSAIVNPPIYVKSGLNHTENFIHRHCAYVNALNVSLQKTVLDTPNNDDMN